MSGTPASAEQPRQGGPSGQPELQCQQPPGPKQFVLDNPRGAYTTIWVRCSGGSDVSGRAGSSSSTAPLELVDWATHLERLVRSLRAMHKELQGCYARYYAWLKGNPDPEPKALQRLLGPPVWQALAAAEQAHAAAQHLMLIVVLPPDDGSPCGLEVRVLAHPCSPPGSSPCAAVVLGGPRRVPEGKDSGWVADRQPLEQLRDAAGGAASDEVLLCTADGRLLEGLVTNFFAVTCEAASHGASEEAAAAGVEERRGGDAAAPSWSGGGCPGTPEPAAVTVWTAGVGDGVVWGTVRARVLQACRTLGYAVREEAPSAQSRHAWSEAFITNALRLVQPLRRVSCSEANVWGLPPWEVELPSAPGPVTAALAAVLASTLPTCPAHDL
ncbi:hypothetical protein ABPG75_013427 [Micractinium tetrahymenae]